MPEPSLSQAQALILRALSPLAAEEALLREAVGRIVARAVTAPSAVPAFARSAMDGYVVRSRDLNTDSKPISLDIVGEIAAGSTSFPRLRPGCAIRIMTGGAVPPGANQVVPYELCRLHGEQVLIDRAPNRGAFLRQKGADLRKGQTIIRQGLPVAPEHLPLLAESGITRLAVIRQPTIAITCTGSELLHPGSAPRTGQIVSGNRFLLDGLVRQSKAIPLDLGLVADDLADIAGKLEEALTGPADIILTTGGMGPGKYDLLPRAFARLGISPLYRELAVRPGRSTMFGTARGKAIFALPGPPPAVFLLFHELVAPAIRKLLGAAPAISRLRKGILTETIRLKKKGLLNLKGAVTGSDGPRLTLRPSRNLEPANAIIHIPAHRRQLDAGSTVFFRPLA
ncbi:molybdopterin molybdotransferase MoeA [Thiovibrio sp. JS02]